MASVAKARLIFMTFRELHPDAQVELGTTPVHTCVFGKLRLPAWEAGRQLNLKNNRVHGIVF